MPVQDQEPTTIRSGDLISWNKDLSSDYAANNGWSLLYTLTLQSDFSKRLQITAAANGAAFLATLTKAQTAVLTPGTYNLFGHVEKASERYQVYQGTTQVLPDLAVLNIGDHRSPAKRALDNARAIWQAISIGQEMTINGRTFTSRDITEIILLIDRAELDYQKELQANDLARTGIDPKHIGVRYARL